MKGKLLICFLITFCLVIPGLMISATLTAQDVPRIAKEELKVLINYTDVTILDVRTGTDWKASEYKIKGAVREDTKDLESWINKYPKEKTIIMYCA